MAPLPWKSLGNFYCFSLAVMISGQIALGHYMTSLNLYHPWYYAAPRLHKGIGVTIFVLTLMRLSFRLWERVPGIKDLFTSLRYNIYGAQHLLLYTLLLATATAGFAFATSKGDPAPFFDLFEIPSPFIFTQQTAELLDDTHTVLGWTLIVIIVLHSIEKMRLFLRRRKLKRHLQHLP